MYLICGHGLTESIQIPKLRMRVIRVSLVASKQSYGEVFIYELLNHFPLFLSFFRDSLSDQLFIKSLDFYQSNKIVNIDLNEIEDHKFLPSFFC